VNKEIRSIFMWVLVLAMILSSTPVIPAVSVANAALYQKFLVKKVDVELPASWDTKKAPAANTVLTATVDIYTQVLALSDTMKSITVNYSVWVDGSMQGNGSFNVSVSDSKNLVRKAFNYKFTASPVNYARLDITISYPSPYSGDTLYYKFSKYIYAKEGYPLLISKVEDLSNSKELSTATVGVVYNIKMSITDLYGNSVSPGDVDFYLVDPAGNASKMSLIGTSGGDVFATLKLSTDGKYRIFYYYNNDSTKDKLGNAYVIGTYYFKFESGSTSVYSGDTLVIVATFVDKDNNPISGAYFSIYDEFGNKVASLKNPSTSDTTSNVFNLWTPLYPGTYYIGKNDGRWNYGKITVNYRSASVSVQTSQLFYDYPYSQTLTLKVLYNGVTVKSTNAIVNIYNNGQNICSLFNSIDSQGKLSVVIPSSCSLVEGTASIEVITSTQVQISGETRWTFIKGYATTNVVKAEPISITLQGLSDEISVSTASYTVKVNVVSNIPNVEVGDASVSIEGPVVSSKGMKFKISPGGEFQLKALHGGQLKIVVTATNSKGDIKEETFNYNIVGYKFDYIQPASGLVNSTLTLKARVLTLDGIPVNNAIVKFSSHISNAFKTQTGTTSEAVVSGVSQNVNDGLYSVDVYMLKSTSIDVYVYKSDGKTLMAQSLEAIKIYPKNDLVIVVDPLQVVAGLNTSIKLSVKDSQNKLVPSKVTLYKNGKDAIATLEVTTQTPTVEKTVLLGKDDKLVIKAFSLDNVHGGTATITPLMPDITVTPTDKKITAGEPEKIMFSIKNPVTGKEYVADNIVVTGVNVVFSDDKKEVSVSDKSSGSLDIRVDVKDTSSVAYVVFTVKNNDVVVYTATFDIGYPSLEVTPTVVFTNVETIFNLALKDAHGNPLPYRQVGLYYMGQLMANINIGSMGKAVWNYKPSLPGEYIFSYGSYAKFSIKAVDDTDKPVIVSVSPQNGTTVYKDYVDVTVVAHDDETYIDKVWIDLREVPLFNKGATVTVKYRVDLVEGANQIVIAVRDAAGNVSDPYTLTIYYKKTSPPIIMEVNPPSGSVVDTPTVMITIKAADVDTYVRAVYINGVPMQISATGQVVVASYVATLNEGNNIFIIRAEDGEGLKSDPYYYSITYKPLKDTEPPVILSVTPTSGITVSADSLTITITASDNVGVETIFVNGMAIPMSAKGKIVTVTYPLSLRYGKNVFSIVAQDAAGNTSSPYTYVVYRNQPDVIPPKIVSIVPVNGSTVTIDAVDVTVTATDNESVVSIYVDGKKYSVASPSPEISMKIPLNLKPGLNVFYVWAEDKAGNLSDKYRYTLYYEEPDTQPPAIVSVSPASGSKITSSTVTVSITVVDNKQVIALYINDMPVDVEPNVYVKVSVPLSLELGENVFVILAKDEAGNVSEPYIYKLIREDKEAPELVSITPKNGSSVDTATIKVEIKYRDSGSGMKAIYMNGKAIWEGNGEAEATAEVELELKLGENTYVISAEDEAGNVSEPYIYKLIREDKEAPELVGITPKNGSSVDTATVKVEIKYRDSGSGMKAIYMNGKAIWEGNGEAEATAEVELELKLGENTYVISAEDEAGNVSEPVKYVLTFEDNTPPQIVSVTPANGSTLAEPKVNITIVVEDKETYVDSVYVNLQPLPLAKKDKKVTVILTATLNKGINTFVIQARDAAGNLTGEYRYVLYYKPKKTVIKLFIDQRYYIKDGKPYPMDVAPFIDPRYSRAMIPLKFFAEAIGLDVQWMAETRTVIIQGKVGGTEHLILVPLPKDKMKKVDLYYKDGKHIVAYEFPGMIIVDGKAVDMEKQGYGVPMIVDGRTFVPIRFILETFGCQLNWNPPMIEITCPTD